MELSEQLVEKMEVKKSQLANKMTKVDGGTLEGTSHEERRAMVALNTVHRPC